MEVGFFGGSFGLGVMEGLGGWLVGGRAGIFNSRIGSFGAGSYEDLGGLFVVVGPGGRISTVDCSRVLNVNRSLSSSTSRGCVQGGLAKLLAALDPTCTTIETPVYI